MRANKLSEIRCLFQKYSGIIRYIFWGGVAFVVNTVVYLVLSFLGMNDIVANTISFFITVQFAYITNTRFVFHQSFTRKNFLQFWGMRLGTILLDNGGMWIFLYLNWNNLLAKCVVNVIVTILNYLFSRFIIFAKH